MQLLDVLSPITAVTAAIVVLLSVIYYFIKSRDILPGPKGLPYFGLFFSLTNDDIHLKLQNIGKEYGDLYSFNILGWLIINLGSVKALREVLVNKSDCFCGTLTAFQRYMLDGVSMTSGERWKVFRKFFIQAFKERGLTVMRDNTAGPIYDSLTATIKELKSQKGSPFNVIELLTINCTGIMRKVFFGENGVSYEKLQEVNKAYGVALKEMAESFVYGIGSSGKLMFHTAPQLRVFPQHEVMLRLLRECVQNIENNMDENHPTCVTEDYYTERNERRRNNDPTWNIFTERALVEYLAQFVGDGIIGVPYFIGCFLNGLVEHPEEQDKIYQELMEVVGPSRMPVNEDRCKLPYTNAFIYEVMRTSNFCTQFLSLKCSKEITVRGFRISEGSQTLVNMWQTNHDPETFENPDVFDPSRYIPKAGKPRAELPVQFGIGERICSGEAFVMMQTFLLLTSIVKNFIIEESPNPTSKAGLFLKTGYMELCVIPRAEK